MIGFAMQTLLWTGALIGLVLLVRRPVARYFGATTAYALWFIPLARLLLPPIVLPAWLRPVSTSVAPADPTVTPGVVDAPVPAMEATAETTMSPSLLPDILAIVLVLWLIGVGVFLVRRFSLYFRMRRDLLAGARPVGEVGRIRIVETPEADGPVAFGVIDKVVALPVGMMASRDRTARDLAIAHELAHHRGHDLLVNFLVQPLFALHWFNPLGWAGWKAMRRDQEAACDARVMGDRPREDRARYAAIIAGFATAAKTAPRHALTAPMACPVLGDKSIVHRLRNLSMSEMSDRRRIAGRLLLASFAMAVPLSASVTYATPGLKVALPPARTIALPSGDAVAPARLAQDPSPADRQTSAEEELRKLDSERDDIVILKVNPSASEGERVPTFRVYSGDERAPTKEEIEELRKHVIEIEGLEISAEVKARIADIQKSLQEMPAMQDRVRIALGDLKSMKPMTFARCEGSDGTSIQEVVGTNGNRFVLRCDTGKGPNARAALLSARRTVERDPQLTDSERATTLRTLDEAMASLAAE